jgi:hypothetical protein
MPANTHNSVNLLRTAAQMVKKEPFTLCKGNRDKEIISLSLEHVGPIALEAVAVQGEVEERGEAYHPPLLPQEPVPAHLQHPLRLNLHRVLRHQGHDVRVQLHMVGHTADQAAVHRAQVAADQAQVRQIKLFVGENTERSRSSSSGLIIVVVEGGKSDLAQSEDAESGEAAECGFVHMVEGGLVDVEAFNVGSEATCLNVEAGNATHEEQKMSIRRRANGGLHSIGKIYRIF